MVDSKKLGFTFFQSGVDGTLLGNKATLLLENALCIQAETAGSISVPTLNATTDIGKTYIIGSGATGAWSGHSGDIAVWDGASWNFVELSGSMVAYVVSGSNGFSSQIRYGYNSDQTLWYPLTPLWSTTEHWTGGFTDGIKIYSKTIDFGALPNATTKSVAHSISPLLLTYKRAPIITDGRVSNGTTSRNLNGRGLTITDVSIDATNVNIVTSGNESAYSAWLRLEYCKS